MIDFTKPGGLPTITLDGSDGRSHTFRYLPCGHFCEVSGRAKCCECVGKKRPCYVCHLSLEATR